MDDNNTRIENNNYNAPSSLVQPEDYMPESLKKAKELAKPEPPHKKNFATIFMAALCFTVAIISAIAIFNKPLAFGDNDITASVSDRGPAENFFSVILGGPQLPHVYQATEDFNVYATQNSNARVVASVKEGDTFVIHSSYTTEQTPTKLLISLEGGSSGFASTTVVDDNTLKELSDIDLFLTSYVTANSEPVDIFSEKYTPLSLNEKFIKLKQWYPHGRYWNTQGINSETTPEPSLTITTATPCVHSSNGYAYCSSYNGTLHEYFAFDENIQCLAFSNLLSDFLFGVDAPVTEHTNLENVKIGDSIRFENLTHSAIVTEVTPEGFYLVEVNEDYENCEIQWDRFISKEELSQLTYRVFSRY